MSKFTARIFGFDGGGEEMLDETYDTYEEAEEEALQWIADYSAGADALELAGEPYGDPDGVDYEVIEID